MRQVELTWAGGDRFRALGSNGYTFDVLSLESLGGNENLASPKDLVLIGAGGCTALDVLSILKKMQFDVTRLTMRVESVEAEAHPHVIQTMHLTYAVWGENIAVDRLLRAIDLSWNKYCAVVNTLKPTVRMSWRAELNGNDVGGADR